MRDLMTMRCKTLERTTRRVVAVVAAFAAEVLGEAVGAVVSGGELHLYLCFGSNSEGDSDEEGTELHVCLKKKRDEGEESRPFGTSDLLDERCRGRTPRAEVVENPG